jgi:NAD(P)-dependent dehydrogenase (short-subunit alcohol dehydrogenase family)
VPVLNPTYHALTNLDATEPAAGNASKAGVIMLGKSLAAEWAAYGIRVNTISPGYMDTALSRVHALDAQKGMWKERTSMSRLGEVDKLNNPAVFLVYGSSSYMTGSDILIDVSHPHDTSCRLSILIVSQGGYTAW